MATLLPAVVTDETPSGPEGVLSENPEGPTDEAEDAPSMLELTAAATDADTETVGPPDTNALGSPLAPPVGKHRWEKRIITHIFQNGLVTSKLMENFLVQLLCGVLLFDASVTFKNHKVEAPDWLLSTAC